MGVMYLNQDHTGAASGMVYGRKGDKVEVLKTDRDLWLVQGNGHKFFIQPDKLSKEKVEMEVTKPEPVKTRKKR
jgi:uncharacterized protein YgiM (DUF1202 family)